MRVPSRSEEHLLKNISFQETKLLRIVKASWSRIREPPGLFQHHLRDGQVHGEVHERVYTAAICHLLVQISSNRLTLMKTVAKEPEMKSRNMSSTHPPQGMRWSATSSFLPHTHPCCATPPRNWVEACGTSTKKSVKISTLEHHRRPTLRRFFTSPYGLFLSDRRRRFLFVVLLFVSVVIAERPRLPTRLRRRPRWRPRHWSTMRR